MKVKNTYSRKKKGKPVGNASSKNVVIINLCCNTTNLNITNVNITNNIFTQGKSESNKSESSDLFDKLVKGPIYNVNNQSKVTFGSSDCSTKFFSKRQDSATSYKSDAEFSNSTNISNHLFKDSKDSDIFTPTWPSPPEYCKIKNKLVKTKKEKTISISQYKIKQINQKKTYNRIQKKHLVTRPNKVVAQVNPAACTSSTPNRSDALWNRYAWPDKHVSPIMPLQYTPKMSFSPEHLHATGRNEKVGNQNAALGLTALVEGLGNLGLETPRLNTNVEKYSGNCSSPDLEDKSNKYISEEINESNCSSPDLEDKSNKYIPEEIIVSNCSSPDLEDKSNKYIAEEINESNNLINNKEEDKKSESHEEDPGVSCLNDHQDSPIEELKIKTESLERKSQTYKNDQDVSGLIESNCKTKIKTESSETKSQTYNKDQDVSGLIESNCKTSPDKELKTCVSQPLGDLTNLALDTYNFENSREIYKRSVSLGKENKRAAPYGMPLPKVNNPSIQSLPTVNKLILQPPPTVNKVSLQPLPTVNKPCQQPLPTVNKLRLQPLPTDLNETLGKITLEAGKKWRRSLLRQKQPETKFDRRPSMSADALLRLIRESSVLSGLTNETKGSWNNTTRIIDSLLENQEAEKSILPVPGGSPGFNLTFSKLSRIHMRKRKLYICDMNEIPEEISDHSTGKCNETEFCEEESVLQQGNAVECESVCDITVNQTDAYETPPILKMNPNALSAITDRKSRRRYPARSWGECSIFSDVGEQNESSDEENNFFTSCCSKLEVEAVDIITNASAIARKVVSDDHNMELMGKVGFLLCCGQQEPITFTEAFPERVLRHGQKIGEGVFGEVFMLERPGEGRSVIKIIPVEGSQMVNGALQKHFDEVLSELIITEELSMLRQNDLNYTTGFCELKNKFYLQGQYPSQMLKLWHEFDRKKGSDNQCPDMFGPDQLFLALELAHAGEPVESFSFRAPLQALAVFLQSTFSLAVAESAAEFEHRDLHIGNVLVQTTTDKYITFVLNGTRFECPTNGTKAAIIDYTLSRIAFKGDVLYLDLDKDPELFTAEGDYQFDIYRHMRADLQNNWRDHQPKTNVRWLHYLIDKLTNKIKYKQKKSTKSYKEYMDLLVGLREIIQDFYSATDLAFHLIDSYSQTVSLIRR